MDKECRKYTLTGGSTQMIGKRNVCNVCEVNRKKNIEMKKKKKTIMDPKPESGNSLKYFQRDMNIDGCVTLDCISPL